MDFMLKGSFDHHARRKHLEQVSSRHANDKKKVKNNQGKNKEG